MDCFQDGYGWVWFSFLFDKGFNNRLPSTIGPIALSFWDELCPSPCNVRVAGRCASKMKWRGKKSAAPNVSRCWRCLLPHLRERLRTKPWQSLLRIHLKRSLLPGLHLRKAQPSKRGGSPPPRRKYQGRRYPAENPPRRPKRVPNRAQPNPTAPASASPCIPRSSQERL